jgi:hypothetical protein
MSKTFTTDRAIRVMAGAFVLISLALGADASPFFVSKYFLWFTAFVGANLLQSGFTRFCPAERIMVKFGMKQNDGPSRGG